MYIEQYKDIVSHCEARNKTLARYFLNHEIDLGDQTEAEILQQMERNLEVMEQAVALGLEGVKSFSGLTGGDAKRMHEYMTKVSPLGDSRYFEAAQNAVAINEVNASMGIICATPTAGSSGIVPGVLIAFRDRLGLSQTRPDRFPHHERRLGHRNRQPRVPFGGGGWLSGGGGLRVRDGGSGACRSRGRNAQRVGTCFGHCFKKSFGVDL